MKLKKCIYTLPSCGSVTPTQNGTVKISTNPIENRMYVSNFFEAILDHQMNPIPKLNTSFLFLIYKVKTITLFQQKYTENSTLKEPNRELEPNKIKSKTGRVKCWNWWLKSLETYGRTRILKTWNKNYFYQWRPRKLSC